MKSVIKYCGCVAATSFTVHSGSASCTMAANPKPKIMLNIAERTRGAEYQDAKYGTGNRVFNPLKAKPNEQQMGRCSICTKTTSI